MSAWKCDICDHVNAVNWGSCENCGAGEGVKPKPKPLPGALDQLSKLLTPETMTALADSALESATKATTLSDLTASAIFAGYADLFLTMRERLKRPAWVYFVGQTPWLVIYGSTVPVERDKLAKLLETVPQGGVWFYCAHWPEGEAG